MSAKPRCHNCQHLRGPRSSVVMVGKTDLFPTSGANRPKEKPHKKPCNCRCHE